MLLSKISRLCKSKKRAVSPVVATVLLIAITVAAAAMVWFVVMPMISGESEASVQSVDSWQDTNANGLCDTITVTVRNWGTADTSITSAALLLGDTPVDSWTLEEEKSVDSASKVAITLSTDTAADELEAGDTIKVRVTTDDETVTSLEYDTPGQFTGDTSLIRTVLMAYSHQDEGTAQFNDTAKIQSLDGDWGPTSPTGSVSHAYYATGTSPAYFDGVFVQFDGYATGTYDPTIHIYIKDGHYSNSWHHYSVWFAGTGADPIWATDSANQDKSATAATDTTAWDDALDETGLELTKTLDDFGFTGVTPAGDFWIFIRLWDASVDSVSLTLS